jgi:catechol 2,3-dioxygenase-like lactoylglutathione lyase family enzyme
MNHPSRLPAPSFHHVHLNSVDPEAAIAFYVRHFPSSRRVEWGGTPALHAANDVLVLFDRVATPAPSSPQTAFWHFGWHVTDSRRSLARYRSAPELKLLPLYTSDEGGYVFISSDAYPGADGVLGRTRAELDEARRSGLAPKGGPGFAYMAGPDGLAVEYAGDHPVERFNHVHMWQEDLFCAQLWYEKHLNARPMDGRSMPYPMDESNCRVPRCPEPSWPSLDPRGTYRLPRSAVSFGDVGLYWYPRQGDEPLAASRGQAIDHIGLGVSDLDAWIAKLAHEDVTFLEKTYTVGTTRAVMIEGPSREAIELIELRGG